MKVYVYKNSSDDTIFLKLTKIEYILPPRFTILGTIDLDIKPEKKVVQKKIEYPTFTDFFHGIYPLRESKNIVIYYDIEE
jgi:hypothetical protein